MKTILSNLMIASLVMVPCFHANAVVPNEDGRTCTEVLTDTLPMPMPQDLCDLYPELCDEEADIFEDFVNGLIDGASAAAMVEKGSLSVHEARLIAVSGARTALKAMKVDRSVRLQILRTYNRTALRGLILVSRGDVKFEAVAQNLASIVLESARHGSQDAQAMSDKTVTSTTKGWFEINFGFFKWGSSSEVTEVETVSSEESSGSEGGGDENGECDDDGICECPTE